MFDRVSLIDVGVCRCSTGDGIGKIGTEISLSEAGMDSPMQGIEWAMPKVVKLLVTHDEENEGVFAVVAVST